MTVRSLRITLIGTIIVIYLQLWAGLKCHRGANAGDFPLCGVENLKAETFFLMNMLNFAYPQMTRYPHFLFIH